jgi:hypothetical protein
MSDPKTTTTPDGMATVRRSARAIRTRFLPPTPSRGARVKAWLTDDMGHGSVSVTINLDYGLDPAAMNEKAALACLAKIRSLKGYECWCRQVAMVQTYIGRDEYAFAMYFADAGAVTLSKAEAADALRLIEDCAGYALAGWEGELDADEFSALAVRYDAARHRLGATTITIWGKDA